MQLIVHFPLKTSVGLGIHFFFHVFSVTDLSFLTCDVDLDLQAAVLGHRHCGSLGDHTTLDCLWHHCPGGAGGRAGVSAAVTGPALMRLSSA